MSRHTYGLRNWLLQRITAVYLACFIVYLGTYFLRGGPAGFADWHAWATRPGMLVASATFLFAVAVHGWVGMRDIVLDYIHSTFQRLLVMSLVGLMIVGTTLWGLLVMVLAAA